MELLNIFTQLGDWFHDQTNAVIVTIAVTFISGLFVRRGWSVIIDKFSKTAKVKLREGAEFLDSLADFAQVVDDSINDDGSFVENSTKELIASGKKVYAEGKNFVLKVEPKRMPMPPKAIPETNKRPKRRRR